MLCLVIEFGRTRLNFWVKQKWVIIFYCREGPRLVRCWIASLKEIKLSSNLFSLATLFYNQRKD